MLCFGESLRAVALREFNIQHAMLHLGRNLIAVNRLGDIEELAE